MKLSNIKLSKLTYLMEGRKALDAHIFNLRQEIAKNYRYKHYLFHGFLKFLFPFTILYILAVKKHTLLNNFLSPKRQLIWQEERGVGYEGRKKILCYILDILFIE